MAKKEIIYNFLQAEPVDFGPPKLEARLNETLIRWCHDYLDYYVRAWFDWSEGRTRSTSVRNNYIVTTINKMINDIVFNRGLEGVNKAELISALGHYHVCQVNFTWICGGDKLSVNLYTSPVAGRRLTPLSKPGKFDGPYSLAAISRAKCLNMPTVHWAKLDLSRIQPFGLGIVGDYYKAFKEWFETKKDHIEDTLHIILKPGIVPVDAVLSGISIDNYHVKQFGPGKEVIFTEEFGKLLLDKVGETTIWHKGKWHQADARMIRDMVIERIESWYKKRIKAMAVKGSIASWKPFTI